MAAVGGGAPSIPSLTPSIKPGSDFYNHVNKEWQKHVHLPPHRGSIGVSEEIEMDVESQLLAILETHRRTHPTDPLAQLTTSFLHTATQRNSVLDLQRILNKFDCMTTADDVAHSIGALNRIQARAPLSLVVTNDSYNKNACCIFLYEPMLGLPNKHYYRAGMKNRIFLKYIKFLQLLGKHMNIDMLESAATLETLMLPYLTQSDDGPMSAEYIYTPLSYTELTSKYKHIAWRELLNGWGAPEAVYTRATYIVTNTQYLKHLNSLFDSGEAFTLDMWRTWMRAMTLLTFVEYLPPPFDDYHFELFGRALKGQTEKLPQKYLTLGVLQQHAKHDLGRLFVDHAVTEGTKAHATRLIKQLKKATIRRIRAIEWMSESTRAAAIAKVEHMKFQVAHPDHWVSETAAVHIDVHHPLTNMINLLVHDTDKMIQDLKHGRCERSEKVWNDGAFEVNAYYYSESNMMVVPAGILRAPFFDLTKSDAWNLGGIGVTIGHEITHGFDAEGRLYDQHGLYNNWWTDDDVAMYNKVTQQVVDLYDGESYMGGKVNGKLTLSENMADLGGMAIGLEALNTLLETVKDMEKRKAAYRDFFISYAVSWRNKDRAKKAKESLFLDVHAPAPLRVNLIVKQFDEFYVAFDVKPGDTGYIPPEERIRLW